MKFLLIFYLANLTNGMRQTHGLIATGPQPQCEPFTTFKLKFVQKCTSFATSKSTILSTPGFSDFYKGNIWVGWTIKTKSILTPIMIVLESIEIDCDDGYLQISEGNNRSKQKTLKLFMIYKNIND
jgi:hypothetical protein